MGLKIQKPVGLCTFSTKYDRIPYMCADAAVGYFCVLPYLCFSNTLWRTEADTGMKKVYPSGKQSRKRLKEHSAGGIQRGKRLNKARKEG